MIKCDGCGQEWHEEDVFIMMSIGSLRFCDLDCKLNYAGLSREDYCRPNPLIQEGDLE